MRKQALKDSYPELCALFDAGDVSQDRYEETLFLGESKDRNQERRHCENLVELYQQENNEIA